MAQVKPDKLTWVEQSIQDKEPMLTVDFTKDKIEEMRKNYSISYRCPIGDITTKYEKLQVDLDPKTKAPIYSATHVSLVFMLTQYKINPATGLPTTIPMGHKVICSFPQKVPESVLKPGAQRGAQPKPPPPKKDVKFGFYQRMYNDDS